MKNFEYAEEQKLIHQIWKVHDEVFSIPAKRYIFCIIDGPMIGCAGFSYIVIDEDKCNGINKDVIAIEYKDLHNFEFQFGDLLIIVYCSKSKNCENDFQLIKKSLNNDFPKHISIIAQCNFLYYRQYIQTYRECLENYKYKNNKQLPKITQLISFEAILRSENLL